MGFSFEGNEGNEGNTGNSGTGGGGSGGMFFADRVGLPFVTVEWHPGSPIAKERVSLPAFPVRNWAPEWYSWLVLTQFVETGWNNPAFDAQILPLWASPSGDWTPAKPEIQAELDLLVTAAQDERPDALDEIVSQNNEFASYFLGLLDATNGYPATAKLLTIASFIGAFASMYYKGKFQRPRPSMLCPALLPPLSVPGHASFPSGHSTQAHLMALCLTDMLEGTPQLPAMQNDLTALADRIARNREIAGFHYPSDTAGGVALAGIVLPLLKAPLAAAGSGPVPSSWYQLAFDDAQKEWK